MAEDIAVSVEHISKDFILPHEKTAKIKDLFTSALRKRNKGQDVHHALRDVSFEVKKGEFFGIVGRNGSGKSTMLKMLAGIYQPTKGKLRVQGKLVPFIELGVGFNPELTGRENVFLNGAMMGFSKKQTAAMYDDIVAFAELEDFMDQKLKNYSSGMQVRLAFSVAIKAEADVLLVDEVLAVGDAAFQRKCYDYFKLLKKNKKTVVFVSHNMDAIREFCDRAVLIEDSRLLHGGDPSKIAARYDRLFVQEVAEEQLAEGVRWGSGQVRIASVALKKKILHHDDRALEFTVTLEGVGENEQLMTGFTVKNATGQPIHGTNTWIKQVELPSLAEGKTCSVTWHCPNIYTAGKFYLDIFTYGGGNVVYEAWEDAAAFMVERKQRQPFAIDPDVTLTVGNKRRAA